MESSRASWRSFLEELRTRRVSRTAITYAAIGFAGLQGAELVLTPLGGGGAVRWLVIAALSGFPVALVLAWFFDLRARVVRAGTSASAPDRPEAAVRPRRWRVAGVAALVLLGFGLYGYRATVRGARVAAAAEVIAIAPFTAVGGEVSALGEGMAQLLAANLDQVGGLRTVDPARVLRAWGEAGARHSDEEALALARGLGAGSVLTGSVVAAGNNVRLSSVLRALDGRELARAHVTGPGTDVLALADSLSNRLLREIWRSRSPIPQLRIAGITTGNLDAIRAYLDGERHYRALRWDSAIAALSHAIELDSTFALAYRRLATVYGWSGAFDSPLRVRAVLAAARTPERLPERERGITVADVLWERDGNFQGALDSLASHLGRYPDDAEALNLRAEILLHATSEGKLFEDDSTLLAAFEAVLQADPDLTPAMIHPMELSLMVGDSAAFRRYATPVLGSGAPGGLKLAFVDTAIAVLWAKEVPSAALLRRMFIAPELMLFRYFASPLLSLLVTGRDPNAVADVLRTVPLDGLDSLSLQLVGASLIALGRLADAERAIAQLQTFSPVVPARLRFGAVAFGLAGPGYMPRLWPDGGLPLPPGADPSLWAPVQATADLSVGDTVAAARALAASAGIKEPGAVALRRFQLGRLELLRGRVEPGLRQMEDALRDAEQLPPAETAPPAVMHRFFLAIAHSQHPATRKQGIEEIRRQMRLGPPMVPVLRIHLARALEAEGQLAEAREQYAVFAVQTRRAEGPLVALNEEAKAALARLTRER